LNALTPLGSPQDRLPAAFSRAGVPVGALELRELRYFAAAARAGNLSRAAQELNVTPPAVSQQLRKLEDDLGTQLLIRHSRGVTPTPAGALLLERIDAILRLLNRPLDPDHATPNDSAVAAHRSTVAPGDSAFAPRDAAVTAHRGALAPRDAEVAAHRGAFARRDSETVSLALPAEIGAAVAAALVGQVQQRWPGLILDIQEIVGGGIEARLLGCQVDIAVLQDPPELDELHVEPLLAESLGLVVSPRSKLAESALPLRLRDLAGVPLILPNPQHWIRRLLARSGFQRGLRIDPVLQVDSLPITRELVRNGRGCTILPAVAVRDETERGALVFRPIGPPALTTSHAIAVRRMAAPMVREVARAMGDAIRSLAASGSWPGAQPVRSPAPLLRPAPSPCPAPSLRPAPSRCIEPTRSGQPEDWRLARPEPARGSLEFVEGD
jgi:LysR family nitrogen assimilation transcriptional regulator